MSTVLVTGGSGFVGSHCILQLLAGGHNVRTTVRNLKREGDVRAILKVGGAEPLTTTSVALSLSRTSTADSRLVTGSSATAWAVATSTISPTSRATPPGRRPLDGRGCMEFSLICVTVGAPPAPPA